MTSKQKSTGRGGRSFVRVLLLAGSGGGVILATYLGLLLYYRQTSQGSLQRFVEVLASMPGWLVPAVCAPVLLTLLFQATRWRAVIACLYPAARPGVGSLAGCISAGMIFNLILPGIVGELAASVLLKRRHGVPLAVGFTTTIYSRFVAILLTGLMGLATWPLHEVQARGDLARYLLHGSMAAMGAATLGLILVSVWPGALRAMADLAGRLLQRLWGGRPSRKLNRIKGHLADLGASGTWFRAVLAGGAAPLGHAALHSGAIAVMHILALKIAAWGMGFPAPWTALALIYALCTFARLAVMVVPPGLALSEVVFFMLAKELLDLSPGHALGYFVVYRAALVIYVAMVLIIGLLSWRGLAAGALDAEQLKRSRDELQEGLGELKSADGE